MVGHDVENQPHAVLVQGRDKAVEFFRRSDFRIQRVVVDDVIAVGAARAGLQNWRGIAVADSQGGKIRNQFGGLRESEVLMELQAIRGERNAPPRTHDWIVQTTDQADPAGPVE